MTRVRGSSVVRGSDTAFGSIGGAAARVLAVLTVLGAAGNPGCSRHPPVSRPDPPPTVERLMAVWRSHQQAFASMNGRARATSWLGGDRVRATVLMLVDRPGRLRFEAQVSLQGTVAVLTTDGRRFAMLDLSHNELRRGPACPANVAALIRIPLAPDEVAAILLGDVHIPAEAEAAVAAKARLDWDRDLGAEILAVPRLDGWLRVQFQPVTDEHASADSPAWRLLGATATSMEGRPRWRVAYSDFAKVAPSDMKAAPAGDRTSSEAAQTIRFAEGAASFDDGVEIKFKQRTYNDAPTAAAFVVEPSPGVAAIEVGCAGAASPP